MASGLVSVPVLLIASFHLVLLHYERVLRLASITLPYLYYLILDLMRSLRLKHFLIQFNHFFAILFFHTFLSCVYDERYEGKASSPAGAFVSHYGHINNFPRILEVLLDVLLLCRVKNSSYEEFYVHWVT